MKLADSTTTFERPRDVIKAARHLAAVKEKYVQLFTTQVIEPARIELTQIQRSLEQDLEAMANSNDEDAALLRRALETELAQTQLGLRMLDAELTRFANLSAELPAPQEPAVWATVQ